MTPPASDGGRTRAARTVRALSVLWAVRGAVAATCTGAGWGMMGTAADREVEPVGWSHPVVMLVEAVRWCGETAPTVALVVGGGTAVVVGTVALVTGMTCAWLLDRRRARGACVAIAVLHLALPPLGTILGIATLVVLARDDVRREF